MVLLVWLRRITWTADTRNRNELYHDLSVRSVLGQEFSATPQIMDVRANLRSALLP